MRRRTAALAAVALSSGVLAARGAAADVTMGKLPAEGWELYTNGRVNGFVSYARGDGKPRDSYDPETMQQTRQVVGGGLDAFAERQAVGGSQILTQGTIEGVRARSGFVANVIGLGARRNLTESTRVTLYISIWAFVESVAHRKYFPVYPDAREGYLKLEGGWGSLLVGRAGVLFSRGATEVDFLYGHGFGLGYPGNLDEAGPAVGHIGFGVLANGFGAGVVYATPVLGGLQLTLGYYDPSNLAGSSFERTRFGRPEGELTFTVPFGQLGMMKLFANGAYQKVYKTDDTRGDTVYGAGWGGRLELGPLRLGVAGHWGKGLGLSYALEPSEATYSRFPPGGVSQLRVFDGFYAQAMFVLGKLDLSAGWGITRVHQLAIDREGLPGQPAISLIKTQTGTSGGLVYHLRDWFHLAGDFFLADFRWYYGEKQVVYFVNAGPTVTW
jgi:hypothetical protein